MAQMYCRDSWIGLKSNVDIQCCTECFKCDSHEEVMNPTSEWYRIYAVGEVIIQVELPEPYAIANVK